MIPSWLSGFGFTVRNASRRVNESNRAKGNLITGYIPPTLKKERIQVPRGELTPYFKKRLAELKKGNGQTGYAQTGDAQSDFWGEIISSGDSGFTFSTAADLEARRKPFLDFLRDIDRWELQMRNLRKQYLATPTAYRFSRLELQRAPGIAGLRQRKLRQRAYGKSQSELKRKGLAYVDERLQSLAQQREITQARLAAIK